MKDSNEFGKNMKELLNLLKKILKSQKMGNVDLTALLESKNVNLNLCFFTFLPLSEEDFADFEYEMGELFAEEDPAEGGDLNSELTKNDLEFLKKYGLKF